MWEYNTKNKGVSAGEYLNDWSDSCSYENIHQGPAEVHIYSPGDLVHSTGYDTYVLVLRCTYVMRDHGFCPETTKIMFQMRPHYEVLVNGMTKVLCQSRLSRVRANG